ncbi:MAG: DUF4397 domain-containing protein [Betaproteobacteria bacterium]
MSFPRISLLVTVALAFVLGGCKVDTINSFPSKPASVRLLQLVPDAPSVDVKTDDATAWTGIGFGMPTAYQSFDNKQTTFQVFRSGDASPFVSASGSLAANQPYALVVFGTVANPVTLIQGDSFPQVNPGNTQLRFVHAAFATAGLDVYVTTPGLPLANLSPQFQMGFSGNTSFALTNTGDYELRLLRSNSGLVAYDSGTISLADQATQTFYFFAKDGTHAINVLKVNNSGGDTAVIPNTLAAVKVVNAAYQTPSVDQKWDGNVGAANVVYPGATQTYYTLPVGTHTITFEASAAPGAAIASASESFVSATDSTILISGANGSQVITKFADNNISPSSSVARVRMINASPDVPAFDVVIDDVVKATNVAYTHASDYFDLDNGNHHVQLMVPGTTTPIFNIDSQQFGTTQVTSFYLVGPSSALDRIITQDNI